MHLVWALALGVSFLAVRVAKFFCIGSGILYLTLAVLGLTFGDSAMGKRGKLDRCYCTQETTFFIWYWDQSSWASG